MDDRMQGLLASTRMRERFQEAESERLRRAIASGSAMDSPATEERRGRGLATLAAALRAWLRFHRASHRHPASRHHPASGHHPTSRQRVERGVRHAALGG
jgi:hypothetical protein